MGRQLLTPTEAAAYLKMSRSWLYDHSGRSEPRVPVIRMGGSLRYDAAELDRFLDERASNSSRESLKT